MQAVSRNADIALLPGAYRSGVPPLAFNSLHPEQLRDVIYLVDDDLRGGEEISACLAALEMKVIAFSSATDYLNFICTDTAACVIVNICLPDLSGLELQRRLTEKGSPPVIFIADHCDIASTVSAMKAGAIEFLTKPVDLRALIAAVRRAFEQDRRLRQKNAELAKLQERFSLVTPREREVMQLIVGGLLNKQGASVLGIAEVTFQVHRSQVMRKMQAESLAELVRMAVKLRIPYWRECESGYKSEKTSRSAGCAMGRGF